MGTQQPGMNELPLLEGAITGAVSFVLGYVSTAVLLVVSEDTTENLFETAGWVYYNAQFVETVVGGRGVAVGVNYVTQTGGIEQGLQLPALVYHLVPVVVLATAGFLLAQQVNARKPLDGVIAGASLALGCVVLAVLGTILFTVESASPDFFTGMLLVGVVYPVICGGLGGLLRTRL